MALQRRRGVDQRRDAADYGRGDLTSAQDSVRLSLRLLTTSRLIEREVDALMRARFDSTIARFDFLSALDRHGALTLGEVSQHLLVSNGNITQLRTRLQADGLIETEQDAKDRRLQRVRLTRRGESVFKQMAKAHAACVDALLRDLPQADKQALTRLLDGAKSSIRRTLAKGGAAP
jgi:DNA-binding MarR family transcriptional regulator